MEFTLGDISVLVTTENKLHQLLQCEGRTWFRHRKDAAEPFGERLELTDQLKETERRIDYDMEHFL